MTDLPTSSRHAKGTNLVELIKVLRLHERQRTLSLSAAARELLTTRVLLSDWYPHEAFMELLTAMYEQLLGRSLEKALQIGIAGSRAALQSTYKAYVHPGEPAATVLAMRHIWRAFFDFGELKANLENERAVCFVLSGYLDVTPVHAAMITAWSVGAAQLAGSPNSAVRIVEAPWNGALRLVYRTSF